MCDLLELWFTTGGDIIALVPELAALPDLYIYSFIVSVLVSQVLYSQCCFLHSLHSPLRISHQTNAYGIQRTRDVLLFPFSSFVFVFV